jgi:hypothetical protein
VPPAARRRRSRPNRQNSRRRSHVDGCCGRHWRYSLSRRSRDRASPSPNPTVAKATLMRPLPSRRVLGEHRRSI